MDILTNVSDLVSKINPDLISNYEKNKLGDKTLIGEVKQLEVNLERKRRLERLFYFSVLGVILIVLFTFTSSIFSVLYSLDKSYISDFVLVSIIVITVIMMRWRANMDKCINAIWEAKRILTKFQKDIEDLNPLSVPVPGVIDWFFVKKILIDLSVSVIRQEEIFENACKKGIGAFGDIQSEGNRLLRYRERLNKAFETSKIFGMKYQFTKRDIYDQALKKIRGL